MKNSVYFIYLILVTWTLTTLTRKVFEGLSLNLHVALSSVKTSLCRWEAGEKELTKKARWARWEGEREEAPAFSLFPSNPACFPLLLHVFLLGYPSRVSRVESSGRFVPGKIKHFERLGCSVRCFGFVVGS